MRICMNVISIAEKWQVLQETHAKLCKEKCKNCDCIVCNHSSWNIMINIARCLL